MDYLTFNEHRTINTIRDDQLSLYDQGYGDGIEGFKADPMLQTRLEYRQGYVKGLVVGMRAIADNQRNHVDPVTRFDWF